MKRNRALLTLGLTLTAALIVAPLSLAAASADEVTEPEVSTTVVDDGTEKGGYDWQWDYDWGKPQPTTTYTEWIDGEWGCDATSVEQTRTKTVTTWEWSWHKFKWVPVVTETPETQTRDLTKDEQTVCPVEPTVVPVPEPTFTDPCGPLNTVWAYDTEAEGVIWTESQVGNFYVLSASPAEGYVFTEGAVTIWKHKDKGLDCPVPDVPIPALFSAEPVPPTCETAGSFDFSVDVTPNLEVTVEPEYTGPGTYTVTATAINGATFPDGETVKVREVTVLGAIGYQSENPEAPCFFAEEPTLVTPTADYTPPTCTAPGNIFLGEDPGYEWTAVANEDGTFTYTAVPNEGYAFPEGAQTSWVADLSTLPADECDNSTPTPTPTPTTPPGTLPETGGNGVNPLVPLGGGLAFALGTVLTAMAVLRRRISA